MRALSKLYSNGAMPPRRLNVKRLQERLEIEKTWKPLVGNYMVTRESNFAQGEVVTSAEVGREVLN